MNHLKVVETKKNSIRSLTQTLFPFLFTRWISNVYQTIWRALISYSKLVSQFSISKRVQLTEWEWERVKYGPFNDSRSRFVIQLLLAFQSLNIFYSELTSTYWLRKKGGKVNSLFFIWLFSWFLLLTRFVSESKFRK